MKLNIVFNEPFHNQSSHLELQGGSGLRFRVPNTPSWIFTFELKVGPKLEDRFLKVRGIFSLS